MEFTKQWDQVYNKDTGKVFVFGSNMQGIHGAGAARQAMRLGASWGVSHGPMPLQGKVRCYAIPTRAIGKEGFKTMTVDQIRPYVGQFINYAAQHPEMSFFVTRVGCGLAGLTNEEMAPLFKGVSDNVELPNSWARILLQGANDGGRTTP